MPASPRVCVGEAAGSTSSTSLTARSAAALDRCSAPCEARGRRSRARLRTPSPTAPWRCSSSASCPSLGVPQIVCDDARAGMARLADALYGHPSGELDLVGVTGTNGKTTTTLLLAAILDAAQRPVRADRHRRAPHRRAARGRRPDDARGARPAARAALDDRGRRRGLRDGGVVDRDHAAAARRLANSRRSASRTSRRTTSTSTATSRLLRRQGVALRRALPARRQRRRPLRPRASGPSCASASSPSPPTCAARPSRCGADRTELFVRTPHRRRSRSSRACAGASTSTTCSAPSRWRCCWRCRWARSSSPWPPRARRPAASSRSRPGSGFGVIVDYAHTPGGHRRGAGLGTPARERAPAVRVRRGRRPRRREAAAHGRRGGGRRRSSLRDERQLALGADRADRRADPQRHASRMRRRARPPPRDRACAGGRRAGRHRADPGQGPRAGPGHRRRGRALRRPHRGRGVARHVDRAHRGGARGHAPAERRSGHPHRERRHRFARGRARRAVLRARGRAQPTGTPSWTTSARPAPSPCSAAPGARGRSRALCSWRPTSRSRRSAPSPARYGVHGAGR